jgi:hypothetical protein
MKSVDLLQSFLLDYSDAEEFLTKRIVSDWFESSENSLYVSRTCYYEFQKILFKIFSLKNDGVSFKINWVKVEKVFANDPEFLEKLKAKRKGVNNAKK